jgi:hypothetical protein
MPTETMVAGKIHRTEHPRTAASNERAATAIAFLFDELAL